MAFWGILVKPDNPVNFSFHDAPQARLQLCQATLEDRNDVTDDNIRSRTKLYCQVGNEPALAICSLIRMKNESCQFYLEFVGPEDVVFFVRGVHDIAVTGCLIKDPPPTSLESSPIDISNGEVRTGIVEHSALQLLPTGSHQMRATIDGPSNHKHMRLKEVGSSEDNLAEASHLQLSLGRLPRDEGGESVLQSATLGQVVQELNSGRDGISSETIMKTDELLCLGNVVQEKGKGKVGVDFHIREARKGKVVPNSKTDQCTRTNDADKISCALPGEITQGEDSVIPKSIRRNLGFEILEENTKQRKHYKKLSTSGDAEASRKGLEETDGQVRNNDKDAEKHTPHIPVQENGCQSSVSRKLEFDPLEDQMNKRKEVAVRLEDIDKQKQLWKPQLEELGVMVSMLELALEEERNLGRARLKALEVEVDNLKSSNNALESDRLNLRMELSRMKVKLADKHSPGFDQGWYLHKRNFPGDDQRWHQMENDKAGEKMAGWPSLRLNRPALGGNSRALTASPAAGVVNLNAQSPVSTTPTLADPGMVSDAQPSSDMKLPGRKKEVTMDLIPVVPIDNSVRASIEKNNSRSLTKQKRKDTNCSKQSISSPLLEMKNGPSYKKQKSKVTEKKIQGLSSKKPKCKDTECSKQSSNLPSLKEKNSRSSNKRKRRRTKKLVEGASDDQNIKGVQAAPSDVASPVGLTLPRAFFHDPNEADGFNLGRSKRKRKSRSRRKRKCAIPEDNSHLNINDVQADKADGVAIPNISNTINQDGDRTREDPKDHGMNPAVEPKKQDNAATASSMPMATSCCNPKRNNRK